MNQGEELAGLSKSLEEFSAALEHLCVELDAGKLLLDCELPRCLLCLLSFGPSPSCQILVVDARARTLRSALLKCWLASVHSAKSFSADLQLLLLLLLHHSVESVCGRLLRCCFGELNFGDDFYFLSSLLLLGDFLRRGLISQSLLCSALGSLDLKGT